MIKFKKIKKHNQGEKKKRMSIKYERRKKWRGEIEKEKKIKNYLK